MASFSARRAAGDNYFKSGRYTEALVAYTSVLARSLDSSVLANRSHCYASLGEVDHAIVDARMSLALTPSAKAYYRLASALLLKDRSEEALAVCDAALVESPDDKALTQLAATLRNKIAGIPEPDPAQYLHASNAHGHSHEHGHEHAHEHGHEHAHEHGHGHKHEGGCCGGAEHAEPPKQVQKQETHEHGHKHEGHSCCGQEKSKEHGHDHGHGHGHSS
mmetsp:Transcript_33274/g.73320  ORF Transcript_33274/g.73320 Transcript_33274/m.73320 type:complete len:219 (-) Transcript_33274:256-912(-)